MTGIVVPAKDPPLQVHSGDREFRPMASSTNATTVLYGTAWSDDSLLERQRRHNLAHEARTGEKLQFEYDWTVLAKENEAYKTFVEGEIARLGEDHPTIQTQYLLRCLTDAGRLFSLEQRAALRGWHSREHGPQPDRAYVAGIDVAGEGEQPGDALSRLLSPRKDSRVVTIAEVDRAPDGQPIARVVDHLWWTGRGQVWQYDAISRLWDRWRFTRVVVDGSGIGAGLADFLAARYPDRLEKFIFTQPSKSKLGYGMLAMINTGRLFVYAEDGSPESRELWHEIERTRYALAANEIITWHVPESEGHDDFVVSLALAARAAESTAPPPISGLIRAPNDMQGGW